MASLIPGYEYDIFISYRQNDNKYDRWVTEFVANLNKELEATIKDKITVYFDANPHDGLLETHSVDRSLEDRLKCLIFMPILSRTYCDPKSYAWNNEFFTFLRTAREDSIGLNVKLNSGNVGSRILPVRIHDLNPEDIALVETNIGAIRSIDFIYKSPGVNRPLRANEDHPQDNLNNTYYRDQINKIANAIDEIILSLKRIQGISDKRKSADANPEAKDHGEEKRKGQVKKLSFKPESKQLTIIFLSLFLFAAGTAIIYRIINYGNHTQQPSKLDKTIAVLPFVNDSPDKENEYFCNGMMEEILNQLQKIGDLNVKSRTSVEKYRNTDKDIKVIGHELEVSYIIEGSVRKIGDNLRITVQLIDIKTGNHLWSQPYDGKYTIEIFEFQSSVAKKVVTSLHAVITPQEEKRIDHKPTADMPAHDLYLKGIEMMYKYMYSDDTLYFKLALNSFNQALELDPEYIDALSGKGTMFSNAEKYDSALFYFRKIDKIDPDNPASTQGKGVIYFYTGKPDSALRYLQKEIEIAPNEPSPYLTMGQIYYCYKNDIIKALPYYQKAYDLAGNLRPEIVVGLAHVYLYIGYYEKALKYYKDVLSLRSECGIIEEYKDVFLNQGKYDEAIHLLDSICSITACEQKCDIFKFRVYTTQKDFKQAEKFYNRARDAGYKTSDYHDILIAYIYSETGRKKEALLILNNSVKTIETRLKNTVKPYLIKDIKLLLAAAYTIMGEKQKALRYLSEVATVRYNEWVFSVKYFPGFDILRDDPEFKLILKQIEDDKDTIRAQVMEMEQRGELHL